MSREPNAPRVWHTTLYGAAVGEARRLLEAKGYVRDESGAGIASYSEWADVDPRNGSTSSDFHVVEDPLRPVIDDLVTRFGG